MSAGSSLPPDSDEQPHGIADHLFEKAVRFKAPGQFEAAFGERALGGAVMDRMVRTVVRRSVPAFFQAGEVPLAKEVAAPSSIRSTSTGPQAQTKGKSCGGV